MRYCVLDTDTNDLNDFDCEEMAENALIEYETDDIECGCFENGRYRIVTNIERYKNDSRLLSMKQIAEIICDYYETTCDDESGRRYNSHWFSVSDILALLSENA